MHDGTLSAGSGNHWRLGTPTPAGELLFRRLLDRLPAGAYTCDADGLITYFNQHAAQLWGRAPQLRDPADRYCGSLRLFDTDGNALPHAQCWMARALTEQREYNGREIVVERPTGERLTVLAHANPIHDESGLLVGAVNVLVDITDRKQDEESLRAADRAKSEFLATMSHEIRTPINAIIGYVELMDIEIAGPLTDGQRGQLARIRAASRHLLSLVTAVLDLSKLEAQQMMVRREPRFAREALESAIAVVQPLAAAKGLTLVNRCTVPDLLYLGDDDRVRQMLINLLSNAIKFSEPGGQVDVVAIPVRGADDSRAPGTPADAWVRFVVRDNGIGIAPDQLERIFEPFVQVESAHTRTRGGTGLGLSITRRLARLMGGELTVQSRLGIGSEFSLWLPAAAVEPPGPGSLARLRDGDARPTARAFTMAGNAILGSLDDILRSFLERLRVEQIGPGARALSDPLLANHAATLLCDVAVTLLALDDPEAASTTLAAGSEIQRVCAIEHGRQRAHLGWDEEGLAREYEALLDEVTRRVKRLTAGNRTDREHVLGAIRTRLELARDHSIYGLQRVHSDD